jgi:hypothetical protein
VLQHDALNGPRLDATGDSQQNEGAQHGALLAMTAAAFEAWSQGCGKVRGQALRRARYTSNSLFRPSLGDSSQPLWQFESDALAHDLVVGYAGIPKTCR